LSEKETNIELRSDEVQEIISLVPNWMIRWGNSLILALILFGFFLMWFIKYPDTIKGEAVISTDRETIQLVSKSSGNISYILPEGSKVSEGELIASIQTNLTREAKDSLIIIVETVKNALLEDQVIKLPETALTFGELQESYEQLKKAFNQYQFYKVEKSKEFEIEFILEQIRNHKSLLSVSRQQIKARLDLFEQSQERYSSAQLLYKNGALAKTDLYDERQKLAQSENALVEAKKSRVQSSITIAELKKELRLIETEILKEENDLITTINSLVRTIENELKNWESTYEIYAPYGGKLAYLKDLTKDQYLESGQQLFAVVPESKFYSGKLIVPKQGFGKLKVGQKVRIALDNFPSHEYGYLEGKVTSISLLPNENNYRVDFELNQGMKSTYGKVLNFTPKMSGSADIITEDLRLSERIFNKFKNILN